MNANIGENELEMVIVQVNGMASVVKDSRIYVDWEMPFPHVSLVTTVKPYTASLTCTCGVEFSKYLYESSLNNTNCGVDFDFKLITSRTLKMIDSKLCSDLTMCA